MSATARTIRSLQQQLANAKFHLDIYKQWKEPLPDDMAYFVEQRILSRAKCGGRLSSETLNHLIRDAVVAFEKQRLESQSPPP